MKIFEGFWTCFLVGVVQEKERPGCAAVSPRVLSVLPPSLDTRLLGAGSELHGKFGNQCLYLVFFPAVAAVFGEGSSNRAHILCFALFECISVPD